MRAAVFGREVAAEIVAGDFVILGAVEESDRACQVRAAIGENAVVGDAQVVVLAVGIRSRQVGRADADRAIGAAVALDHVVGDLQIAGIGVDEDRAALRFDIGQPPRVRGSRQRSH